MHTLSKVNELFLLAPIEDFHLSLAFQMVDVDDLAHAADGELGVVRREGQRAEAKNLHQHLRDLFDARIDQRRGARADLGFFLRVHSSSIQTDPDRHVGTHSQK